MAVYLHFLMHVSSHASVAWLDSDYPGDSPPDSSSSESGDNEFLEATGDECPLLSSKRTMAAKPDPGEALELIEQQLDLFTSLTRTFNSIARNAVKLQYLRNRWDQCRLLHQQISAASLAELKASTSYFTDDVFGSKELAFLSMIDVLQEVGETTFATSTPENRHVRADSTPSRRSTQVPRIQLPHFSGDYAAWPTFKDYFESLFIKDVSFDNLQRLHYLKACLDGEASNVIKSLAVTADNFEVAWSLLQQRYANTRMLVQNSLNSLFSLSPLTRESASELRNLLSKFQETILVLKNLKRPVDQWDDLLVHVLVGYLDKTTRKAWELSLADDNSLATFAQLETFLLSRVRALESVSTVGTKVITPKVTTRVSQPHALLTNAKEGSCSVCTKQHKIYVCPSFVSATPERRLELVKGKGLCTNCMRSGHFVNRCPCKIRCRVCCKVHHSMLHRPTLSHQTVAGATESGPAPEMVAQPCAPTPGPSSATSCVSSNLRSSFVILATVWVKVSGTPQREVHVRALIDQGSTHTLVTEELVNALNTHTYPATTTLSGIGGASAGTVQRVASLQISPRGCLGPVLATDALVLKRLTSYAPNFRFPVQHWPYLRGLALADPEPESNAPISLIIVADLFGSVIGEGIRKGDAGQPIAQHTVFGWVLSGPTSAAHSGSSFHAFIHTSAPLTDLNASLLRFWELEECPKLKPPVEEDIKCEEHFLRTHSRDESGRYIVRIPFKMDPPFPIGSSLTRATRILFGLETRLARNPTEQKMYAVFLRDYLDKGHMRLAADPPSSAQCIYLPHHPVIKMTSKTTKLRVVFNASAPTSNSVTLNDLQYVGPKLQLDLPLLLSAWRTFRFVCCGDIAQMYSQIRVHEDDVNYQRIRWRFDRTEPVNDYQLLTVTFGTGSAPFLAQRTLKQFAIDDGDDYPLAVRVLCDSTYVDDCLVGADDLETARTFCDQLIALLGRGGFTLRKWASNEPTLLDGLDSEDHGLAIDRALQAENSVKVLGLVWHPLEDIYQPLVITPSLVIIIKRSVLSTIARLFDPLGWLSPVVVTAKILMQALWKEQLDWDSPLPPNLATQWTSYCRSLWELTKISIPRWTGFSAENLEASLIGFSDASSPAYAAVLYIRVVTADGQVQILVFASKNKVAPVKEVSIPRLELCAAVLLAQLIASFKTISRLAETDVFCFSDSAVVLAWLEKQSSLWKTFVANRVAEIHSLLPNTAWRHVLGEDNPTDLASRGVLPRELPGNHLWWSGPSWLSDEESQWPREG